MLAHIKSLISFRVIIEILTYTLRVIAILCSVTIRIAIPILNQLIQLIAHKPSYISRLIAGRIIKSCLEPLLLIKLDFVTLYNVGIISYIPSNHNQTSLPLASSYLCSCGSVACSMRRLVWKFAKNFGTIQVLRIVKMQMSIC